MSIDGYLKVPDIPGPSERDGHEEEIEVHGVAFSIEAPYDATTLARRKRPTFDMIVFSKYYDMSSPYLKSALVDNTRFDEVVFSARRTVDEVPSDYLVVTLTDASVARYEMQTAADEEGAIEERIGFAYQSITFTYDSTHETTLAVRRVT